MVTVVLPVYNAERFLRLAIDSILRQSYTNFELIIINDGSTDASEHIIRSYTDSRIRYLYQSNSGVASSLNRGIELAKGEYIWRHDADDISLPDKLEKEIDFLTGNPSYVLCACQVAFMTEHGKVAQKFRQPQNTIFKGQAFIDVRRAHFDPYSPITHGTVLVRTNIMRELKGYRSEFIVGEDVDLWLRLIQKYKAAVLNECLSYHRISATSATRTHGWKNDFFRNLAFIYYVQREETGMDDLQRGLPIVLPEPTKDEMVSSVSTGKKFRDDFLPYLYPLHINAKDWPEVWRMLKLAVHDGWKLKSTWRAVLFPLLGKKVVQTGVRIKNIFR